MPQRRTTLKGQARAAIAAAARLAPGRQTELTRLAIAGADLARQAGDPILEAEALLSRSNPRAPLSNPAQVLAAVQRAESIFAANALPARAAACLVAQANALSDLGEERRATAAAERALACPGLTIDDQVYAHVVVAACHLHTGDIDAAWQLLQARAEPLARLSGKALLQSRVTWMQGLTQMVLLIARHHPDLWIAYPTAPRPTLEARPLDEVIGLFDAAARMLQGEHDWGHLHLCRHACLALFRADPAATVALDRLATATQHDDPPLAVRALMLRALLHRHAGALRDALAVLSRALALAEQWGQVSLCRDIHLHLSRTWESLGAMAQALDAFKRHAELVALSLRPPADARSGPAPAATEASAADPNAAARRRLEPAHVRSAVRFIDGRLAEPLHVADVAAHCGVARRTLELAFREFKSTTVGDFIAQRRMERAADALRHTAQPVQAIARAVGYRSASAFAREFRARHGAQPSDWRRAQRRGDATAD